MKNCVKIGPNYEVLCPNGHILVLEKTRDNYRCEQFEWVWDDDGSDYSAMQAGTIVLTEDELLTLINEDRSYRQSDEARYARIVWEDEEEPDAE